MSIKIPKLSLRTVVKKIAYATQLSSARTIALTGAVTGSGSFDGSADLSIATLGSGADGSFTTADGKTVTVVDGLITEIV